MSAPVPTLAEMSSALAASDAECYHLLKRLRDLLASGEYALISRENRELALDKQTESAIAAVAARHSPLRLASDKCKRLATDARTLLQLPSSGDPT